MRQLFAKIAKGFNLSNKECTEVLKYNEEQLATVLRECFQQIQDPRQHFSESDYKFLIEGVGCVNLEDELFNAPLTDVERIEHIVVQTIFDMPIRFTESELLTSVYCKYKGDDLHDTVRYILGMFNHPNVRILDKQGEYYSVNHATKITIRSAYEYTDD
jgi:hypothetical protein